MLTWGWIVELLYQLYPIANFNNCFNNFMHEKKRWTSFLIRNWHDIRSWRKLLVCLDPLHYTFHDMICRLFVWKVYCYLSVLVVLQNCLWNTWIFFSSFIHITIKKLDFGTVTLKYFLKISWHHHQTKQHSVWEFCTNLADSSELSWMNFFIIQL